MSRFRRDYTASELWKKEPFRVGLIAGLSKSRHFLPEVLFDFDSGKSQEQYTLGYQASTVLKKAGVKLTSVPKTLKPEVRVILQSALDRGDLL